MKENFLFIKKEEGAGEDIRVWGKGEGENEKQEEEGEDKDTEEEVQHRKKNERKKRLKRGNRRAEGGEI